MTSSDGSQQPVDRPYQGQEDETDSPGGPSLDEVVRETLNAQGMDQKLAPEVRREFDAIARRHAGKQTLDLPIAKEFVDAVLSCRFEQFRKQPEARAAATDRIARALWEDDPSRERLDRLWNTLREGSP